MRGPAGSPPLGWPLTENREREPARTRRHRTLVRNGAAAVSNAVRRSSEKLNAELRRDPAILLLDVTQKKRTQGLGEMCVHPRSRRQRSPPAKGGSRPAPTDRCRGTERSAVRAHGRWGGPRPHADRNADLRCVTSLRTSCSGKRASHRKTDTARPRHTQGLVPSKSQDGGARAVGVRGRGVGEGLSPNGDGALVSQNKNVRVRVARLYESA